MNFAKSTDGWKLHIDKSSTYILPDICSENAYLGVWVLVELKNRFYTVLATEHIIISKMRQLNFVNISYTLTNKFCIKSALGTDVWDWLSECLEML